MEHIRPVVPAITGDDLVAEGAEAGPSLGAALRETLDAVREGRVTGHDEQLHYAMDCVRQRSR
jgi:hypothetical protein